MKTKNILYFFLFFYTANFFASASNQETVNLSNADVQTIVRVLSKMEKYLDKKQEEENERTGKFMDIGGGIKYGKPLPEKSCCKCVIQ